MSTNLISSGTTAREKVNLRTPDVMAAVQQQVESHYRSDIVEKIRRAGGMISVGDTTVRLAKQFGFCYGVERAIDLAYAARKVFKDRRLFIVGEIIHNPEVNQQIASLGIRNLTGKNKEADISDLGSEDVVIVPAFGTELSIQQQIKDRGCQIVDTTCGDVMSVWKRVRKYASESATSIIHGKAEHEETKATSSRALGDGTGHYLVVLTLADTDYVCDYIRHGGNKRAFLEKFKGAYSPGFDPDVHLQTVGVANQTTMLRGETEEVQRRVRQAIMDRDGPELAEKSFRFFDTICGATQERQDALRELLNVPMDLLLVVGGYNSSNTSHLAEMGEEKLPTYFVLNASRLFSATEIKHYDLHEKREIVSHFWLPNGPAVIGITAGASCPNNLIEETLIRLFELRGISRQQLELAA
ncbi:MAG TPA: 4-hydroxy-3-methylbut-2-enyl diphosphate reductase [Candidatus Limnocylindria bacterium]|jgi:4-hydroxy-3-methylbut-2-en-1-yl diphosphate reductase|nr:4-hydroxy-3-methylbut-2-enyl diphosphate reductase [Candidatus Limnocylindria bacterium]